MAEERELTSSAIQRLQKRLKWRPGKAAVHLSKRIAPGHLPTEATLADYEAVILRAINTHDAEVFVYLWDDTVYPTAVAELDGTRWLIMMGLDGTMETAFPPEDPDVYLADQRFRRLGILKELGL